MTRVWPRLVLLGVLGNAAVPVRGSAQPAPAPASGVDKKQVARQYTEAALAAAKLGDYDTAIGFYQKAYQLVPHPTLIFDIAEAQRLAGRVDQALSLYRRYLSDAPTGPLAGDARHRIAQIDAAKADAAKAEAAKAEAAKADAAKADAAKAEAAKAEAAKAEAAKAEAAKAAEARRAAEKADANREAATATPSSGPPGAAQPLDAGAGAPEAPDAGRNLRIAGMVAGAGGVVGLGLGIGYALHGRSLSDEVSKRYDPQKVSAGHDANTFAAIGLAGGTALLAAGAGLYWWGYTHRGSTERVSLAPVVSDQGVGLVVAGAWR